MTTSTLSGLAGLTDARRTDELAEQLEPLLRAPTMAGLSRRDAAIRAVDALATKLDQPLDQLVKDACERDPGVQAAGQPGNGTSGHEEHPVTVTLGAQILSLAQTASVELDAGAARQVLLEVEIAAELAFTALKLDLAGGRVVRVHPAESEASIVITAAGVEIARREKVPITLGAGPTRTPPDAPGEPTDTAEPHVSAEPAQPRRPAGGREPAEPAERRGSVEPGVPAGRRGSVKRAEAAGRHGPAEFRETAGHRGSSEPAEPHGPAGRRGPGGTAEPGALAWRRGSTEPAEPGEPGAAGGTAASGRWEIPRVPHIPWGRRGARDRSGARRPGSWAGSGPPRPSAWTGEASLPAVTSGPVERLLIWTAGKDTRLLFGRSARVVAACSGAAIWLTALASSASVVALLAIVTDRFRWSYLAPAILWGTVVWTIDRSIVASLHTGNVVRRVVSGLPRLAIAVVFGLLIAEPVLLWMFQPEIEAQLSKTHEAALAEERPRIRAEAEAQVADRREALDRQKEANDTAVTEARGRYEDALDDLAEEGLGTGGTGRPGAGPVYQERVEAKDAAGAELVAAVAHQEEDARRIADERARLDEEVRTIVEDEVQQRQAEIEGDDGLLAREDALDEVIDGEPRLEQRRWLVRGAILLVDLMPVVLSVLTSSSSHDLVAAEQEKAALRRARRSHQVDDGPDAEETFAHARRVAASLERERIDREADVTRARWAAGLDGATG